MLEIHMKCRKAPSCGCVIRMIPSHLSLLEPYLISLPKPSLFSLPRPLSPLTFSMSYLQHPCLASSMILRWAVNVEPPQQRRHQPSMCNPHPGTVLALGVAIWLATAAQTSEAMSWARMWERDSTSWLFVPAGGWRFPAHYIWLAV